MASVRSLLYDGVLWQFLSFLHLLNVTSVPELVTLSLGEAHALNEMPPPPTFQGKKMVL